MSGYGPQSYNLDINQLGTSTSPRFAIANRAPYKDAIVEDIIINDDHPLYDEELGKYVGLAKLRLIPDDRNVPSEQLNWVMPIDSSIREYPLKNEMVMVFYVGSRMFYTKRININNKITENSWPGLAGQFSPATDNKSNNIVLASQGGSTFRPWNNQQELTLGNQFIENSSVRMLRQNEGDMVIQGRFGNSIRMGSSLFSNPVASVLEPNLLLTVGQNSNKKTSTKRTSPFSLVDEDINEDKSSIWMVTDEKILLRPATIDAECHLRSTVSSDSNNYVGAQIFINSDRLIMNSKRNEISLFAKKEINLSAVQSITIDSAKTVELTGDKDILISSGEDIIAVGNTVSLIGTNGDISLDSPQNNVVISGRKIFIGSGGAESQPMVLGADLALWLAQLISTLSSATIITSTGPALFDPTVTLRLTELLSKLLPGGRAAGAVFNSTSNFTSKEN